MLILGKTASKSRNVAGFDFAPSYPGMASLEGDLGENVYELFKEHAVRSFRTGHEAQGSPARFATIHCLTQYWTTANIQKIVFNTEGLNCQVHDIRNRYLRIWSILVWISMTGRPYVQYVTHFVRSDKDDDILPLRERPAFIPRTNDAEIFWTTFFKNQWKFCPVQLEHSRMYNRDLHPNQILPFTISGDVGSQNIGRPASIRLAKVHASDTLSQTHLVNFLPILHAIPPTRS